MIALVITLIIAGLLLLAAELVLIPGFGVAGILGVGSIVASCWLAFTNLGATAGIIVIIVNIILVTLSTVMVLRSKTWKKISLKTNIDAKVDTAPAKKGIAVGERGKTLTRLAPGGKAEIGENIVEVFTRDSLIEPGIEVKVCELEGNKIFVKESN